MSSMASDDTKSVPVERAQEKSTILIVEDNALNRMILASILEEDYHILEAADGVEAVEILEQHHWDIMLVLLDMVMPRLDGLGVLTKMHERGWDREMPVMMISADTTSSSINAAYDLGALDYIKKPFDTDIILRRIKNVVQRYVNSSKYNQLTGLMTGEAFCESALAIVRAHPEKKYAVANTNIVDFKTYNEAFGTQAGNAMLKALGHRMSENNYVDKSQEVLHGFMGSDRFLSFAESTTMHATDSMRQGAFLAELQALEPAYRFTVCTGFCDIAASDCDLMKFCDKAYFASRSIKGNVNKNIVWYDEKLERKEELASIIMREKEIALQTGQFVPYFQPQYNYVTGALTGTEVLVRWLHPERGLISPGQFIPAFEEMGFIYELDKSVWQSTCAYIRKWKNQGLTIPPISVNISRYDIAHADLIDTIINLLQEFGLKTEEVRLEITESAYMQNPEMLGSVMRKFQDKGFFMEMDDFGSGYSSLTALVDLPFDLIKLDMGLLRDSTEVGKTGSILAALVGMARRIGLPIIAEGVEKESQAEFLKSIGCYDMQGYYFSRPIPPEDYEKLLRNNNNNNNNNKVGEAFEGYDSGSRFLDIRTQEALLFNSFVGGACIVEYDAISGKLHILRTNDNFYQELGITRQQWGEAHARSEAAIGGEDYLTYINMFKEAIATGKEAECTIKLPYTQRIVWLAIKARVIGVQGNSYLLYTVIENVSEIMELNKRNAVLAHDLQAIIDNLPGGLIRFRLRHEHLECDYVSRGLEAMLGYGVEQMREIFRASKSAWLLPLEERLSTLRFFRENIRARAPFSALNRVKHKNGNYIYLSSKCLFDGVGDDCAFYMFCADVTEEKKLQEEVQRSGLEKDNLLNSITGGTLVYDIYKAGKAQIAECSSGITSMLGYTEIELRSKEALSEHSIYYPADYPKVKQLLQRQLAGGGDGDITFRLIHKNGSIIWVRAHSHAVRQADGHTRIYTALSNLSSSVLLYHSIIDEAETAVMVVDKSTMEILFVNKAAIKIFGKTKQELVGQICYRYLWGREAVCANCAEIDFPEESIITVEEWQDRYFEVRRRSVEWNGADAIISFIYDRTKEREFTERLTELMANMPSGVATIEVAEDGSVISSYVSERFAHLMDYASPEAMEGDINSSLAFLKGTTPEVRERFSVQAKAAFRAQQECTFDLEFLDGKILSLKFAPHINSKGRHIIYIEASDVTAERENEERVRLAEQKDVVMSTLGDEYTIYGVYYIAQHVLRISHSYAERHGIPEIINDYPCSVEEHSALKVDRGNAEKLIAFYSNISLGRPTGDVVLDYALPNGQRIAESLHFVNIYDKDGKAQEALIAVEDITAQVLEQERVEELKREISGQEFVKEQIRSFEAEPVLSKGVDKLLAALGEFTAADRTYLVRIDKDTCSYTNEWCAPSVPPSLDELQDIPLESIADWLTTFRSGETVYIQPEAGAQVLDNELLLDACITSVMAVPVLKGRKLYAFIGLDNPDSEKAAMIRNILFMLGRVLAEHILLEQEKKEALSTMADEYAGMLKALARVYPLTIFCNLTKNEYHMLEYDNFINHTAKASGNYDELIEAGASTIPYYEDKNSFVGAFNRENLLQLFSLGQETLTVEHRQISDSGEIHWNETTVIRVPNTQNDDVLEVTVSRLIDRRKKVELQFQNLLDDYKQAQSDARRDFLTGLNNRLDMFDMLRDSLSGKREQIRSMFMLDVDDFKKFNDRYGHVRGDDCLRKIGKALVAYGVQNDMVFYRYGGEEILGVCFGIRKEAQQIAEEILQTIRNLKIVREDRTEGIVTVSLGYTDDNSRYEKMVEQADEAMYKAKMAGKNCAHKYVRVAGRGKRGTRVEG